MNILIWLIIITGIAAIWQLIRVYELTQELSGREDDLPSEETNRINGFLFFAGVFGLFATYLYLFVEYKHLFLPAGASEHGASIDALFNLSTLIITIAFVITHILLGFFAYRYYSNKSRKAVYYHHNNRIEFIWTIIPALVLTGLIVYGITVWTNVTSEPSKGAMQIEVYGRQFQWFARYKGKDNEMGKANYRLIGGANALGLDSADSNTWDDLIANELHLPVNKDILLTFRSQDVIHSAYLPQFRVQMNCVPGMTTRFHFIPTLTTLDMRKKTQNDDFEYYLLCNKICGNAHFNMKMNVVVETEEEFNNWLNTQKPFMVENISVLDKSTTQTSQILPQKADPPLAENP